MRHNYNYVEKHLSTDVKHNAVTQKQKLTISLKLAVYHQRTYLTYTNNNFVLTYNILVNKVNNEIHNLL